MYSTALFGKPFTHCFVDPQDIGTVCQRFIRPEVGHGLRFNARALLPLQHAGTRRAIEGVNLEGRATNRTKEITGKAIRHQVMI